MTPGHRPPLPASFALSLRGFRLCASSAELRGRRRNRRWETCTRNAWGPAKMTSDAPPAGCLTRGTTGQDLPRSLLHEADISLGRHLRKPRWTEGPSCVARSRAGRRPAGPLLMESESPAGLVLAPRGSLRRGDPATARRRRLRRRLAAWSPAGLNLPAALLQGLLPTRPRSAPSALRGTRRRKDSGTGLGGPTAAGRVWSPRLAPRRFPIRSLLQFVELDGLPLIMQVEK